ncbi:hypothetical protein ABPG75_004739 [Micractinium tetrahymenae]
MVQHEHREALFRSRKERNDELAKPPGQRDEARLLRANRDTYLRPPLVECCADCLRVRQRAAASCEGQAAWNEAWELISTRRLEALEQGQPYPPLTLPYLELHLPDGMPEELPPSIDRCSACQSMLDQYLYLERKMRTAGWACKAGPVFEAPLAGWPFQALYTLKQVKAAEPFKANAFKKVADIVDAHTEKITAASQLKGTKGAGPSSLAKVTESLETGTLVALTEAGLTVGGPPNKQAEGRKAGPATPGGTTAAGYCRLPT